LSVLATAGQFDVGKASASATFFAPSGTVSDARTIQLVVG
jgi:hypothetical protein